MIEQLPVTLNYIVLRKTFPGWKINLRRLQDYEIVLVVKGCGWGIIENKPYSLKPGDLLCIRPGRENGFWTEKEPAMEIYAVHFSLLQDMDPFPLPEYVSVKSAARLEMLLHAAASAARQHDSLSLWRKNLAMQQVLLELFELTGPGNRNYRNPAVLALVDRLGEDPLQKITMEEMLARTGLKKTVFLAQFRQITGTTPRQYITNLRLEMGADLILNSDLPVGEIAARCGYEDPLYFSRCFQNRYRMPPSRYRQIQL